MGVHKSDQFKWPNVRHRPIIKLWFIRILFEQSFFFTRIRSGALGLRFQLASVANFPNDIFLFFFGANEKFCHASMCDLHANIRTMFEIENTCENISQVLFSRAGPWTLTWITKMTAGEIYGSGIGTKTSNIKSDNVCSHYRISVVIIVLFWTKNLFWPMDDAGEHCKQQ